MRKRENIVRYFNQQIETCGGSVEWPSTGESESSADVFITLPHSVPALSLMQALAALNEVGGQGMRIWAGSREVGEGKLRYHATVYGSVAKSEVDRSFSTMLPSEPTKSEVAVG